MTSGEVDPSQHGPTRRAFLSRTSEFAKYPSSRSYIQAAIDACNKEDFFSRDMSYLTADTRPPAEVCRQLVSNSDVYIGIIGFNYGSPVRGEPSYSYTEIEYETARECGIPILVFMLDDEGDMPPGLAIGNADLAPRQNALRNRLRESKSYTIADFRNPDHLHDLIATALRGLPRKHTTTDPWPPLPEDVHRPAEFTDMCDAVRAAARRAVRGASAESLTIGLVGAGGFGKTTLAKRVCQELRADFPEKVLYKEFSEHPTDRELIEICREFGQQFEQDFPNYPTPPEAGEKLGEVLGDRRVLLVIDGVTDSSYLEPFLQGGPSTVRLVTTRDADVLPEGTRIVKVEQLSAAQSQRVLSWDLPVEDVDWNKLVARANGSTLLAVMINAALREESSPGRPVREAVTALETDIDSHLYEMSSRSGADALARDAVLEACVERFAHRHGPEFARHFRDIAIFPDGIDVPFGILAPWWGMPVTEVHALATILKRLSLVEAYDSAAGTVRLHDVVRSHLRAHTEPAALQQRHGAFLTAHRPGSGRWADLPDDAEYLWRWTVMHLGMAHRFVERAKTLSDGVFLSKKATLFGPTAIVDDLALAVDIDHSPALVLALHGPSGVGKTGFLEQVAHRLASLVVPPIHVLVPLDETASITSSTPLRFLRNRLDFDCPLFDVALLTLWQARRQRRLDIGSRGGGNSIAVQTLNELLANTPGTRTNLPSRFATRVYDAMPPSLRASSRLTRPEFEEIDRLLTDPKHLDSLLPEYLARAINVHLTASSGPSPVFLFDIYGMQSAGTSATGAAWLQSFVGTLRTGIHVVASREPQTWDLDDEAARVFNIGMTHLPTKECRLMIRRELGVVGRDVEDELIKASRRIPFYLRALIEVCRADQAELGMINVNGLPSTNQRVVERFLERLSYADQACALAAIQYFDEPLFQHLTRAISIENNDSGRNSASVLTMPAFTKRFFVKDVGEGGYRTDEILTVAVRDSSPREDGKKTALIGATSHLLESTTNPPDGRWPRLSQFYHSLVLAWQSTDIVPNSLAEHLVDIGYNLFDAGYEVNLPVKSVSGDYHPARLTAQYFAALTAGMRSDSAEGLRRLESLAPMFEHMGQHSLSGAIEVAYLREIGGDYYSARKEFLALSEQIQKFDGTRRNHVRARLYHGDMLIMDGKFVKASGLLRNTYEAIGPRPSPDWVELVRHRGHAYRFSLEFKKAEALYEEALKFAGDAPNVQLKLLTNLAETRCWSNPEQGIEDALQAIERNRGQGNLVEVVKGQAALGVGLALLRKFDQALEACESARLGADAVRYPAGRCFADQAQVIVEAQSRNTRAAAESYQRLAGELESLTTYCHLRVVPAWFRTDGSEFALYSGKVEWISPNSLQDRLYGLIR